MCSELCISNLFFGLFYVAYRKNYVAGIRETFFSCINIDLVHNNKNIYNTRKSLISMSQGDYVSGSRPFYQEAGFLARSLSFSLFVVCVCGYVTEHYDLSDLVLLIPQGT